MSPCSSSLRLWIRRQLRVAFVSVAAVLTTVAIVSAHDFWIIPDLFNVAGNASLHMSGRSGTRFPHGTAVQPARVSEARVIGADSEMKITQFAVEGTSLRMQQKPAAPGQYLIAVALAPRTTRSTPAGLLRFLRLEGGASEADRLERENAVAGQDSLSYTSGSLAYAVVQLGSGGPRAFTKSAGYALEFIPLNDPSHVHQGDTLHVRLHGAGKPVPNLTVYAGPAVDSSAATQTADLTLTADANGVVHVPLSKAGPWNLRAAFVYRNAAANDWQVARATYVFGVGTRH